MGEIPSDILKSALKLDSWLTQNGWQGYDPYDIKAVPWVLELTEKGNNSKFWAFFRELVFEFFYTFPVFSRNLLKIDREINPKAMGLFSAGYLDLYKITDDKAFLEKSQFCLDWLMNNRIKINGGTGWGYPFEWQSGQRIPRNTPNGIVTTAAGDAFWNFYQYTNDKKYLDECIQICKFLVSLPVDKIDAERICFSYTPVFMNHVHNLNLFVAEFLIKTGMTVNNPDWIESGIKAVNYTVSSQLENGLFDYNGPPEPAQKHYDNYHTGFVLRMLHSLDKLIERENLKLALKKGYDCYITSFFEGETIPKLTPNKKYRIDIHSCAESILCLSTLSDIFPEAIQKAGKVLNWSIEKLQDNTGYFYFGILKSRLTGIKFRSKMPYLRWGQAWMLRAISKYLLILKQSHN
jgi:hypothetical protein